MNLTALSPSHHNFCFRGDDFRQDYGKLSMLCAAFPNVPIIAMTATANKQDRKCIKDSLGLLDSFELVANPDRKNIFYEKLFRHGQDIDAFEDICRPIAHGLLQMKVAYPLTIIYMPLKWCGFIYRLFESVLGADQYYPPGSLALPKNRLFAQFHAPQTAKMKEEILEQLNFQSSKIRVVLATIAFGMGVDIRSIRQVIHIGPPRTIREYFKKQAEQVVMDNHRRQSSITTTETLSKIKWAYKKKSDYIVRVRITVCGVCFYNVWTLSISHYHVL